MSDRGLRAYAWLALLACGLLACETGGSETGNPVAAQMALGVRTEDPDLIGIRSGSGGAVLHEAWFAFGEVTFLGPSQCANLGDIDIVGPTMLAVDLAREDTPLEFELRAKHYCGLAVPLNLHSENLRGHAPAELADHSIVLLGERADGTAFELMHSEQDTLELAAEGGQFAIERDGPRLLLSFDVAQWMDGIDLDSAELGDDGVIHIDVENNRPLVDRFEANLECALQLYADDDGDDEVGATDTLLARCQPD